MEGGAWRRSKDGLALAIRLTPKSSRDAIEGLRADSAGAVHVAARVRAVPDKGAANAALEKLVAAWLGVPASSVSVISGHTARLKTIGISGDPAALEKALGERLGTALDEGASR